VKLNFIIWDRFSTFVIPSLYRSPLDKLRVNGIVIFTLSELL